MVKKASSLDVALRHAGVDGPRWLRDHSKAQGGRPEEPPQAPQAALFGQRARRSDENRNLWSRVSCGEPECALVGAGYQEEQIQVLSQSRNAR